MRRFRLTAVCLLGTCLLACSDGPSSPITQGDATPSPMATEPPEPQPTPPASDAPQTSATPDPSAVDPTPRVSAEPTPIASPEPSPTPHVPTPVTCVYRADDFSAELEVNTWRGDVERVTFWVRGLPDPTQLTEARLRYRGYDVDHPGGEGWIRVNESERFELPADEALDNAGRDFDLDVAGRLAAGDNRVRFIAFDGPEGAFYRISKVRLRVTGLDLDCPDPVMPPTGELVRHPAPAGIAAFGALASDFPRDGTLEILGNLERPFTTVLLDFGPVYTRWNLQMFSPGAVGSRQPNPQHFAALTDFLSAFAAATPRPASRHVQLYLLNGPGVRRPGYDRAYPQGPEDLDRAVQNDAGVRNELSGYLGQLVQTVRPHIESQAAPIDIRLAVGLEDNYSRAGARALRDLARAAGFSWPIGRNPCGCGPGDTRRMGDFHERHPHGTGAIAGLPGELQPPDAFSNDGWGFTVPHNGDSVDGGDVTEMARKATASGLWFHLWYDPIQGYPIPNSGPRNLRFDHTPGDVLTWLRRGLEDTTPGGDGATGNGVERRLNYRDAEYENRRNWVLDCRDYAYSARGDEHEECDHRYRPDGSTGGRAVFRFNDVIADRYEVWVEGRHTTNRNPARALFIVNGVEKRINQRSNENYKWELHGTYALSGSVTVVLDSTREVGSDAVRNVRITPVR